MTAPSERPSDWVQQHMNAYLSTNGEEGHIWNGVPTALLTTIGRVTGNPNTTPLIYGQDGDRYLLVGSRGGAPRHPGWYRNLAKNPNVELQVMGDKFAATARTATPDEKPALWAIMAKIFPNYDEYQARTERVIPVIVIERKP
jgi:deazaflavin-dependent oxidoreductase (nitroreductase family)